MDCDRCRVLAVVWHRLATDQRPTQPKLDGAGSGSVHLPPGLFTLRASARGYDSLVELVTISRDGDDRLVLRMQPGDR